MRGYFFRRKIIIYQYVAYNESGEIVKGRLSAASEEAANEVLAYASYRAVSLKPHVPFISFDKLESILLTVKPAEIILFCRQLAMLLEVGTNLAASIELLQEQTNNRLLKNILGKAISDVRGGIQLSKALGEFPRVFPSVYIQLLSVGEISGNFETVLRQVADYMERETAIRKETRRALILPAITLLIAIAVVGTMVMFVVPAFGNLYSMLGQELPFMVKMLIKTSDIAHNYGMYILLAIFVTAGSAFFYVKTPRGRHKMDRLLLSLPILGNVIHLTELSRCCRSMSLLFHAGVPLTGVLPGVIQGCGNRVITTALLDVQQGMLKGQGLSRPMAKNRLFLPMMVQMVRVGEEAGNLNVTLLAVARSYEAEADDKMHSLISLIQPTMTVLLGAMIGIIAISLFQTIYGMEAAF